MALGEWDDKCLIPIAENATANTIFGESNNTAHTGHVYNQFFFSSDAYRTLGAGVEGDWEYVAHIWDYYNNTTFTDW